MLNSTIHDNIEMKTIIIINQNTTQEFPPLQLPSVLAQTQFSKTYS